jgi:hypothetical protein
MNFLKLLPVILSFILLGAHFYRAGMVLAALARVAVLILLFLRKKWVPRLFQVLLFLGALEWLRTLYMLAGVYMTIGKPWTRMAIILGTVALLTALSGLVFRNRKLAARYRQP